METIIYYKSKNGFIFTSKIACSLFDKKADQIKEAMDSMAFLELTEEENLHIKGQILTYVNQLLIEKLHTK